MLPPSEPAQIPGPFNENDWFALAVQTVHVPIAISSFNDGRFVEVNQAFLDTCGYTRDEVIGHSSLELGLWVDPESRQSLHDWLSKDGTVTNYEMQYRAKSGKIGDLLISSRKIESNGNAYLISFGTDITALRHQEKVSYSFQQRLEAVLTSQSQLVFHQDADLRYTWIANPRFGFAEAEVVGRNDEELFGFKTAAPLVEIKKRVLATGERECQEVWLTFNGETRGFDLLVSPYRDPCGNVTGIICVAMDITAEKCKQIKPAQNEVNSSLLELQRTEEQLRFALDATKEGIWDWNLMSGEIQYSPAYFSMLGFERDELPMDVSTWIGLLHPDEVDRVTTEAGRLLRDPGYYALEYRMRKSSGDYCWVMSHGKVVERDADGKPLRAVGTHIDITEQKKTYKDLERMHLLMKEGENIAKLGTWEHIIATQETIWSTEEYRIYGLDPHGASPNYPTLLRQSIHQEDAEKVHLAFLKAVTNRTPFESENRIVRPDGSVRVVLEVAYPYFDETGQPVKYIGTTLDITERRQLEESVRQSELRLRSIVEGTSDAVFIKDKDGRYVLANRSTARFVGKRIEEIQGNDDTALFPPEQARAVMERDHQIMTGGENSIQEQQLTTADGVLRTFLSTKGPLLDSNGNIIGMFGISRDITDFRRAEQDYLATLRQSKVAAETTNLAKSRFLANMSHEMRTPLHHIAGMSTIIRSEPLSQRQLNYLDKLDYACQHLTLLIERILDLTQFESGNFAIAEEPLNLEDLIDSISANARDEASKRHLYLVIEDVPATAGLLGDKKLIQRALKNYLSNAIRFTREGNIQIRTEAVEEDAQSVLIRFEVEDTGEGIKPEDLPRLFSIFEQVDNSPTRKYDGLGLGLAMTRKIAEAMGGEAGCTIRQGKGSAFWFTVRLRKRMA
jgi:PAS domain S-box-containing protein